MLNTNKSISQQLNSRFNQLYFQPNTKQISQNNRKFKIISNPKQMITIIRFVQTSSLQIQIQTFQKIYQIISSFPLNAVKVYQQGQMILPNNKIQNIFDYIYLVILENYNKNKNQQLNNLLISIFELFLNINNIAFQSVKRINQSITSLYYQNKLDQNNLKNAIQLISKVYQKSLLKNSTERIPFLYFLDSRDQIKVVLTNNKWNFSKGFRIAVWFYIQKVNQSKQIIIWSLKTEDHKLLSLKITQNKQIQLIAGKDKQISKASLGKVQSDQWIDIEIDFYLGGGFIFGGYEYKINSRVNNNRQKNLNITMGKYSSSDIITEIIFLKNFTGRCRSILFTIKQQKQKQLINLQNYKNGIHNQSLIQKIITQGIQKKQNIFILYSPARYHEQIIINCVSQDNNSMFSGHVSNLSKTDLRFYNKLDQLIPYFYMITFLKNNKKQLFQSLLKFTVEIIKQNPYQRYLLIIAFIIINDNYTIINTQTLKIFAQLKQNLKYKYIIDLIFQNFSLQKIVQQKISIPQEVQLLLKMPNTEFYYQLRQKWNDLWHRCQSFNGFWAHPQFRYQNNKQFNSKQYIYSNKKLDVCKWGISNFITKQFCRPLLQPFFSTPGYAKKKQIVPELEASNSNIEFLEYLKEQDDNKQLNLQNIVSRRDILKKLISKSPEKGENKKVENKVKDYKTQCLLITNLYTICGVLQIIQQGYLIYLSNHKQKIFDHLSIQTWKKQQSICLKWKIQDIKKIKKRRFNQDKNSFQIIFKDSSSYVFYLLKKDAQKFLSKIGIQKIYKVPLQHFTKSKKPSDWIDRKISNFYYMMWLNYVSGRSYEDLTQYFVIPWTVINFTQKVDFQKSQFFRDLNKNMGSLGTQGRKKQFLEKYSLKNQQQLIAQYHYGTHYSSSAIICNFLIRLKPYADGAMSLQSGKFDCADRVFSNYQQSWNNALISASDVRQLIPQFYVLPQMYINVNNYDFGLTQTKQRIDNVILPAWSKNNPYIFVSAFRKAIQSENISKNLNGWIDLIFGQKQRGKQAIQSMNIYYPLTYEDSIDLTAVDDQNQRISFESQIAHFGQTPSQIIPSNAHPKRGEGVFKSYKKLISDGGQFKIFKNLDNEKEEKVKGEIKIFNSILESKISILKIKFFKANMYAVFRKKQIFIYKIIKSEKKSQDLLITKQKSLKIQLQANLYKLDLKNLQNNFPVGCLDRKFLIGGYFSGYVFMIFYEQTKKNQFVKVADDTITAIGVHQNKVFYGTSIGELIIYNSQTQFNFKLITRKFDHNKKINDIQIVQRQRMLVTCSNDAKIFIYNLYSFKILRMIINPNYSPILYAKIASTPLFCIVFFSRNDKKIYSYSLNGQYLHSVQQQSGNIYNPKIIRSSQHFDTFVYINANKTIQIQQLPFIELKRKIQLKKNDTAKISVFEISTDSRIAVVGTVQGSVYIITDPNSF